jgi:hypothetical protein
MFAHTLKLGTIDVARHLTGSGYVVADEKGETGLLYGTGQIVGSLVAIGGAVRAIGFETRQCGRAPTGRAAAVIQTMLDIEGRDSGTRKREMVRPKEETFLR